eukprot:CAMPEP_0177701000 /NCGR_PEP_ID=MMETSP0484_2-20121128/6386_1 /TAXON_ID=354590 /ORGANISM="Rhodomonas lens, Strain RHODO" /LENGTH=240 /DNA_ID=CAMNT_0019212221 /DNA_START=24 /DNA_END=743 /DNA_ORIENTATION=+
MIVEVPRLPSLASTRTKGSCSTTGLPQFLWKQEDLLVGRTKRFVIPISASEGQKYVLSMRSLAPRPAFMCSVTLKVNGPDRFETVKLLKGAKVEGDSSMQLTFEIPSFHKNQVIEAVVELASVSIFARARVAASIEFAEPDPEPMTEREVSFDETSATNSHRSTEDNSVEHPNDISEERPCDISEEHSEGDAAQAAGASPLLSGSEAAFEAQAVTETSDAILPAEAEPSSRVAHSEEEER